MFLRNLLQFRIINKYIHKHYNYATEATIKNITKDEGDEVKKARQSNYDKNAPTIFDKILSKEIKADIIFEDDKCLAFNDVSPQAPVHFLIIPKQKIVKLEDGRPDDIEIFGHLMWKAGTLGQERAPNGFRVVINNGKDGAQSVYYLHLHVIGGRQMKWPPG